MKAPAYSPNAKPTKTGWVDETGRIVKHCNFSQEEVDSWYASEIKEVDEPKGMSVSMLNEVPEVKGMEVEVDLCLCGDPDCECPPGGCDCKDDDEAGDVYQLKPEQKVGAIQRLMKSLANR